MANTDSIWSKKFVQGRSEHAYEEHLPSCPPPLPPKLWPTPAALGLSNVSRRLSCGSHCPSICDAQRSFWSFWKALQQNIQSYFFKSHLLLKLMSNSKCQEDFYKLSFHTKCSSWFQLHLWRRKKKSRTLFLTAGTMIETVPKHLLLQFHLSFIPLLSSTFSTLQSPPFSSSAHCPLCLYLLSDFCSSSPLWALQWLQPQVYLTFLPRLRTAWRKAHCNTDHFQNLLQAQTIPPRLASLLRKYVSVQK